MHPNNPFNPTSVVTPSLFAGRVKQVDDICTKLTQLKESRPASFFIYGDRGIGKTALATLIKFIASSNEKLYSLNLMTSYYEVDEHQSIASVLQQSINKLIEQQDKSFLENIKSRVSHLFLNNKFTISMPTVGSLSVENKGVVEKPEITIKDETVSILSQIIRESKNAGENKKDGILIIIDEIHNVQDISSVALMLRNILTTLTVDGYGNVSFLLIGYEGDMKDFFSKDSSSRRAFDLVPLGVMPDNEAYEILEKGLKQINMEWEKEVLMSVVKASGGYPHSVQLVGHNLVQTDTDSKIDEKDVSDAILETAVQLRDKDFSHMYPFRKKLMNKDKVLAHMISLKSPITRKAVLASKVCTNIPRCLTELKDSGAIKEDNEDGTITFHSQLFRTAVSFDQFIRKYDAMHSKSSEKKK